MFMLCIIKIKRMDQTVGVNLIHGDIRMISRTNSPVRRELVLAIDNISSFLNAEDVVVDSGISGFGYYPDSGTSKLLSRCHPVFHRVECHHCPFAGKLL